MQYGKYAQSFVAEKQIREEKKNKRKHMNKYGNNMCCCCLKEFHFIYNQNTGDSVQDVYAR